MFRKYHYLNYNLHKGSKCFVGTSWNKVVCFIAILPFPHAQIKNFRRVHRLVTLPDYQGVGIGNRFLEFIGRLYLEQKYRFIITTSNPALIWHFNKNPLWQLKRSGYTKRHRGWGKNSKYYLEANNINKRNTTSWEMIKDET